MQKMRKWPSAWLGTCIGLTTALMLLVAMTIGSAAAEPQKTKPVQQPAAGQQICPATPGGGVCKVVLDCPTVKNPGKTTCEATIDCPGTKQPVKPKTKQKSKSE